MQPPVWAKVWATNGVRLWRKRVAGEPNHLKESHIWVTFQVPIFKTMLIISAFSSLIPISTYLRLWNAVLGEGEDDLQKIVCQPFPITMMMVTMMEVSNTILIHIFVNNNMFPKYSPQDPTLSCWATCSCSWGLMWKVSAMQKLVIFTSIRFFLDFMRRKSQPPISKSL